MCGFSLKCNWQAVTITRKQKISADHKEQLFRGTRRIYCYYANLLTQMIRKNVRWCTESHECGEDIQSSRLIALCQIVSASCQHNSFTRERKFKQILWHFLFCFQLHFFVSGNFLSRVGCDLWNHFDDNGLSKISEDVFGGYFKFFDSVKGQEIGGIYFWWGVFGIVCIWSCLARRQVPVFFQQRQYGNSVDDCAKL